MLGIYTLINNADLWLFPVHELEGVHAVLKHNYMNISKIRDIKNGDYCSQLNVIAMIYLLHDK